MQVIFSIENTMKLVHQFVNLGLQDYYKLPGIDDLSIYMGQTWLASQLHDIAIDHDRVRVGTEAGGHTHKGHIYKGNRLHSK